MNNYIGKHEKLENIQRPIPGADFHGESWYQCPKCGNTFEFYDTQFERGFTKIRKNIYQHNECGQLIDMT